MLACAYTRVSGKGQIDKDGLKRQSDCIDAYAIRSDLQIIAAFPELGVTGTNPGELRPAWMELLNYCESQGVRVLVVEKLDRLARDLMIQEILMGDLQKLGIELRSTMEADICSTDPTRVMIRQLFGMIAQYEKSQIVRRLRMARERIRASGKRCEGPLGFGNHSNKPSEREALELMKSLYAESGSANLVAADLNDRGIVGARGGLWTSPSVLRVLRAHGVIVSAGGDSGQIA